MASGVRVAVGLVGMTIDDLNRRIARNWHLITPHRQAMLVQRLVEIDMCTRVEAALLFGLSLEQIDNATAARKRGQTEAFTIAMGIGLTFQQANDERIQLAVQYAIELA